MWLGQPCNKPEFKWPDMHISHSKIKHRLLLVYKVGKLILGKVKNHQLYNSMYHIYINVTAYLHNYIYNHNKNAV